MYNKIYLTPGTWYIPRPRWHWVCSILFFCYFCKLFRYYYLWFCTTLTIIYICHSWSDKIMTANYQVPIFSFFISFAYRKQQIILHWITSMLCIHVAWCLSHLSLIDNWIFFLCSWVECLTDFYTHSSFHLYLHKLLFN